MPDIEPLGTEFPTLSEQVHNRQITGNKTGEKQGSNQVANWPTAGILKLASDDATRRAGSQLDAVAAWSMVGYR